MPTIIDSLYGDNQALLEYLTKAGEVSLASLVADSLRKGLVLCAASYFETSILDAIVEVV